MDPSALQQLLDKHARQLDELRWLLLPQSSISDLIPPETSLTKALTAPSLWSAAAAKPCPTLLLLHADGQPKQLNFLLLVASADRLEQLQQLPDTGITQHISEAHSGWVSLHADASSNADEEAALFQLAGLLFAEILSENRPLRHYDSTLLLPLDLRLDSELTDIGSAVAAGLQVRGTDIERYRVPLEESLLRDQRQHQPADDDDPEHQQRLLRDQVHHQAYEFFSTHLRDQLFERETSDGEHGDNTAALQPIVHWCLPTPLIQDWSLELYDYQPAKPASASQPAQAEEKSLRNTARVADISLYQYYNQLFVLALRLQMPATDDDLERLLCDEDNWWQALVYGDDQAFAEVKKRQTSQWLHFTKHSRVLFAEFREQLEEAKISLTQLNTGSGSPASMAPYSTFSEVITYLLRHFLPDLPVSELTRAQRLHQIDDSRMLVNTAYALCGPAPAPASVRMAMHQRLFSLALYVDEPSDAWLPDHWAYDADYTRELMQRQMLSRWASSGKLSGYTDYSSVDMGFGWFFSNVIAPVHVPIIYGRIQLAALFYRASLELFDRRITTATNDLVTSRTRSQMFRKLRGDFIEFTNNYWFRELSPQIQGQEICERMMCSQRLEKKYETIKDQMERADEYAAALRAHWFQRHGEMVGWIATILAVCALLLPLLGKDGFAWSHWQQLAFIGSAAVFALLIYLGFRSKADSETHACSDANNAGPPPPSQD